MEAFVAAGIWWFPDQPNVRFDAILKYSFPQGATLTPTSDQFTRAVIERYGRKDGDTITLRVQSSGTNYEAPILNGIGAGRQFSLLHCHLHPFGGDIGLIVEGAFFDTVEAATFPAYSVSCSGLDEWGASGRLNGFFETHEGGKTYFQLSYEMPPSSEETLTVELEDVFLEICHSVEFPSTVRNHAALTESTEFRVLSKDNRPLSAVKMVETYLPILCNFLMLATWTYVKPLHVKGWIDTKDVAKGQVTLYWQDKGMGLPIPKQDNDWLFTMRDLGDRLGAIIQAWVHNWEVFQPIVRNYFTHRYIQESFIEVRFLTYMQALEAYAKNKKLNKKLFGLLTTMQGLAVLEKIVGNDLNSFVKTLVDVRDALTHEARLNTSPVDIVQYTRKLELIILLSLFRDLGFSDDHVRRIAEQNIGFQTRM